ncbi:MAG TPA: zinc ribbon domain-containing protein [Candidatus Sulfotelmatobacter sp.]|nr:zinc ribbon domain-containing protein [Candidatus Sulfotelmatobacter sp.]
MPLYDYDCARCGPFTVLRPMAECEAPHDCPDCGASAPRVILTAPRLALMDAGRRNAATVNERSAHAPRRSAESGGHAPGCTCCTGSSRSRTRRDADGAKSFPSSRPWMISH